MLRIFVIRRIYSLYLYVLVFVYPVMAMRM